MVEVENANGKQVSAADVVFAQNKLLLTYHGSKAYLQLVEISITDLRSKLGLPEFDPVRIYRL